MKRIAFALVASAVGCNLRPPVLKDMTCPTGAELRTSSVGGACQLPGGTKNGPAYRVDPRTGQLLEVETWDHDVLDGPYARYGDDGQLLVEGMYRNGKRDGLWVTHAPEGSNAETQFVADAPVGTAAPVVIPPPPPPPPAPVPRGSSNVDTMAGEAAENARETEATGIVASPARVRVFRFEGDIAFDAHTAYTSANGNGFASGFVGATAHAGIPFGRLGFKQDHYSGLFVSLGATGSVGRSIRTDGPWGERWLLGPYARIGYARSHDARDGGAIRSFSAYVGVATLFGEDLWALSNGARESSFVWRTRVSAGYTAPGIFTRLVRTLREETKKGDDLLTMLALAGSLFIEHGELFLDVGSDGVDTFVSGFGVQLGFGL